MALPVFGAGILSAVVYAPDAVVDALRRGAQQGAVPWMAGGVVLIMLLFGFAYRSNVRERPDALGDYGAVRDRLGSGAGVVTGAALLVDYIFTVAVSVAAVTGLIEYLVPAARGWEKQMAILLIAVMTFVALRVMRERARVLLAVWYGFLLVIGLLWAWSTFFPSGLTLPPIEANAPTTTGIILAYAGAIASGAVMVTGIEYLASAGPHHAPPRGQRAGLTLLIAVGAAAIGFFIVMWLAWENRVNGYQSGPVILSVAHRAVGSTALTWAIAFFAAAILYAAASAIFRRFSNLAGSLAQDGFLPRQMSMPDDRLVFRGGVLTVAIASSLIIFVVGPELDQLIHMYVVGLFVSVVLSQIAMVRHFTGKMAVAAGGRPRTVMAVKRVLHAVAAVVGALVLGVVAVFNFFLGAWMAVAMIIALVLMMRGIKKHYERVRMDVAIPRGDHGVALPSGTIGVVLVTQVHRPALRAVAYAKAARHSHLEAVAIQTDPQEAKELRRSWGQIDTGVPLVVLDSPFRDMVAPVLTYVREMPRSSPRDMIVVYVPEYIVGHWWEQLLHNRSAARLREELLNVPGVVVAAVPWQLESARATEKS
jgi:hypothetical protein